MQEVTSDKVARLEEFPSGNFRITEPSYMRWIHWPDGFAAHRDSHHKGPVMLILQRTKCIIPRSYQIYRWAWKVFVQNLKTIWQLRTDYGQAGIREIRIEGEIRTIPWIATAVCILYDFPASKRTHDAIIMSSLRKNDAATSFWRNNDALIASRVKAIVWTYVDKVPRRIFAPSSLHEMLRKNGKLDHSLVG